MIVRNRQPDDERAWLGLRDGYRAFYGQTLPEAVTQATWQRRLDPASSVLGRVAAEEPGREPHLVGLYHYVLHAGTWNLAPACHLEDLLVAPEAPGSGIGRSSIDDVLERADGNGWARVYWHTQADDAAAHQLYDRFVQADNFVRHRLSLDEISS